MIKRVLKRKQLAPFANALDLCSKVQRKEGEDKEQVNRFKYRCARNMAKAVSLYNETTEKQDKAFSPDEEILAYWDARHSILEKYARKDKDGNPIVERNANGEEFVLDRRSKPKADKELEALQKKMKRAVKRLQAGVESHKAILEEEVELEIMTWPFSDLPDGISGGWYPEIAPMLTEVPKE